MFFFFYDSTVNINLIYINNYYTFNSLEPVLLYLVCQT